MILTALVLFCCNAIPADAPRTPAAPVSTTDVASTAPERTAATTSGKPDAPTPKLAEVAASKTGTDSESASAAAPEPAALTPISSAVKPAVTNSYESPTDRKIWYGLMIAGHGTAAFDAWTTRRAISGGYGIEGDPLERPFAQSGAIYATTQVTPLIMDYLGHRMMRSRHDWIRKAWWVPQAASASVSLGAGIHNYRMAP